MVNKNNAAAAQADAGKAANNGGQQEYVESPKMLALISSLTALLLQVKNLADGER